MNPASILMLPAWMLPDCAARTTIFCIFCMFQRSMAEAGKTFFPLDATFPMRRRAWEKTKRLTAHRGTVSRCQCPF